MASGPARVVVLRVCLVKRKIGIRFTKLSAARYGILVNIVQD